MTDAERVLLQRIVDCCGSPTWHAVRRIIAERDALRSALDAATASETSEGE